VFGGAGRAYCADPGMSSDDLLRLLWDPTAPLPATWPAGGLGAFLLFLVPVGGGIPLGVLMARDAGVSPVITALLYMASDVVIALFAEPWLAFLRWVGRRVPFVGRVGERLSRLSGGAGLKDGGARGPLGLVLVSFTTSPTMGRAATSAAGHGFFSGWALAITGDMLYFVLLMASTLWISGVLGDERVTVGAVLVLTWVLPTLLRRLHARRSRRVVPAPQPIAPIPLPVAEPVTVTAAASSRTRRRPSRNRVSRARGLHG
jgi:hypothetical protein